MIKRVYIKRVTTIWKEHTSWSSFNRRVEHTEEKARIYLMKLYSDYVDEKNFVGRWKELTTGVFQNTMCTFVA